MVMMIVIMKELYKALKTPSNQNTLLPIGQMKENNVSNFTRFNWFTSFVMLTCFAS